MPKSTDLPEPGHGSTPPVVHAVVVHHRGREMLAEALASLLDSRDVRLEIVLVSNHCLEPLPEVVDASERLHLVSSERSLGFSAANNLGIAWARAHLGEADYYYFVNNDTRSTPEALACLIAAMREDGEAGVAGPRLLILGAPDHLNSLGLQVTEDAWGWDEGIGQRLADYGPLPERRPVLGITGSALLIDAALHLAVGGWTEVYGYYFEDIDLCIKAWEKGRRVLHVPEAVVYHRISATMTEDETGTAQKHYLFWRNRLLLAMIHWPRPLLARLLRRAVLDEVARRPWAESAMQRRALGSVLLRLPLLLRHRWGRTHRHAWCRFLHPPGSVPVITLPATGGAAEDPVALPAAESGPGPTAAEAPAPGGEEGEAALPAATWQAAADLVTPGGGRRVLVLGCSPLPFEEGRMNYAPSVRTWQLARPLVAAGHAVAVACQRIPGATEESDAVEMLRRDGAVIYTLPPERFNDGTSLPGLLEAFEPDVLVGASPLPSRRAVRLAKDQPVWVDLFGDLMAESQARAAAVGENDQTAHCELLIELLSRGDAFAAVSERQRYAVIGQLGLYGRLNRATHGRELVYTLPCAAEDDGAGETVVDAAPPELGDDAFVVLWSGGFNTWCDVETLVAGLETAMEADGRIRLVATGAEIRGHDEKTYRRFTQLVSASRFAERFLIKGALPKSEADRYLARADLAVVTEKQNYERELGSSARVARWVGRGVPFVCGEVSELSRTVREARLGWTYPPGDPQALARTILEAAADPEARRQASVRCRAFAAAEGSFDETARPLVEWAAHADRLPDHDRPELLPKLTSPTLVSRMSEELEGKRAELKASLAELEITRQELVRVRDERRRYEEQMYQARQELGRIHHSKMWRIWMGYLALRGFLLRPFGWIRRRSDR